MSPDLDPRFTFDSFVVGPANRLAVAAARRVADAPGTTYNPLFIYSASGLGKTHLLTAAGLQLQRLHDLEVRFETLEHLMEEISAAVEAGERDVVRSQLRGVDVLLLDDIQFVAGQRQVQEELIRAWDALTSRGGQVVLTSDRPPQDIDGLDDRLLSRLSGGLIVDVGVPDFETRIAIARRKTDERGQTLSADVLQAVARVAFTNVRELQGALNRLIAVQELEGRTVGSEEVARLLGAAAAERGRDEFGEFLADITGTVGAVVAEGDRRVADAILAWEGEGYRTRRLDGALTGTLTSAQAEEVVRRFEQDVTRLRAIEQEIRAVEPEAAELRADALRDPDRVAEAESLLAAVRERHRPAPALPDGPSLDAMEGDTLALRAARAVAADPGGAYNPLFVLGPVGAGKSALLVALARELSAGGKRFVAYIEAKTFAAELVEALQGSRLDAWRARYRGADALLIDDMDDFAGTERAQEELFHLFEDLRRMARPLVFAAAVPPHELRVPARLRSRLESGLVVELEPRAERAEGGPGTAEPAPTHPPAGPAPGAGGGSGAVKEPAGAGAPPELEGEPPAERRHAHALLNREKVLWEWPYAQDWLEESLD